MLMNNSRVPLGVLFGLLAASFFPSLVGAASDTVVSDRNIGFPTQEVWLSADTIIEGETVFIHAIVLNDAPGVFTGTMEFYDDSRLLGKTPFSVTGTQKVRVVSLSWEATAGEHRITAKIADPKLSRPDGSSIIPHIAASATAPKRIAVERDADGNGIRDRDERPQDGETQVFTRGAELFRDAVPGFVSSSVRSANEYFEALRIGGSRLVEEGRGELRAQIRDASTSPAPAATSSAPQVSTATTTAAVESDAGSMWLPPKVLTPIRYAYLALLAVAAEILSRPWLYYLVLGGIAFFALRSIYRILRGRA